MKKSLIFFIIILSLIFCNKAIRAEGDEAQKHSDEFSLEEYNAAKYLQKGTEGNFQPVEGEKADDDSIFRVIGRSIEMILSLIGIILIILIIYSGYLWFSADGNEEQITSAKSYIKNAALGIAVVFLAYAITMYIISKLGEGLIS